MPIAAETCAVMACAIRVCAARSRSRVSATTMSRSVPVPDRRRQTQRRILCALRHLRHDVFDFVRVEVTPGVDDDVFYPAGDVDLVFGPIGAVAGVDPAFRRASGNRAAVSASFW